MTSVKQLTSSVKRLVKNVEKLRKLGVNQEILEAYIAHKTRLPKRDIKKMLSSYEDFCNKIVSKEVAEKL